MIVRQFGCLLERQAFERRCESAKLVQTSRFAVAPDIVLPTLKGDLPAGHPVEIEDLIPQPDVSPSRYVEMMVEQLNVLELTDQEIARNKKALKGRYFVNRPALLTTTRGILTKGEEIHRKDILDFQTALEEGVVVPGDSFEFGEGGVK